MQSGVDDEMNGTPLTVAVQALRAPGGERARAGPLLAALGAIGAGVSAACAFESRLLVFVALAPLMALSLHARARVAAAAGAAAGVVAAALALRFVPQAALAYAPDTTANALPLFVVGAVLLGAPWGVATGLGGLAERRLGRGPLVTALVLTAWELFTPSHVPLALGARAIATPWGSLASVLGQSGLTLLVALTAAAITELAFARIARRSADRLTLALALGALVVSGAYGAWRRAALDRAMEAAPHLELAVAGLACAPRSETTIEDLEGLVREGAHEPSELIVLPESSVSATLPDEGLEPLLLALLSDAGRGDAAPTLLGVTSRDAEGSLRNVALSLDRNGALRAHEKARLLPFAERPVSLPLLGAVGAPGARYVAGRAGRVELPRASRGGAGDEEATSSNAGLSSERDASEGGAARVEIMICYEDLFGDELRRRAGHAPRELLVELTNDAWLRASGADELHALAAELRAVELGRSLAVSNRGGRSRVLDPGGRELAALGADEAGWLRVAAPLMSEQTPYARWGAAPIGLALAALLAIAALIPRVRRASRAHARAAAQPL